MPSHPLKNRYRQLSIPERDKLTYYTISYTSIWFFLVPNSSLTSKQWTFKSWLDLWHLLYVFSSSKLSTSNYHSTNNSQTDWLLHQCAENKNQLKTNRWHKGLQHQKGRCRIYLFRRNCRYIRVHKKDYKQRRNKAQQASSILRPVWRSRPMGTIKYQAQNV